MNCVWYSLDLYYEHKKKNTAIGFVCIKVYELWSTVRLESDSHCWFGWGEDDGGV